MNIRRLQYFVDFASRSAEGRAPLDWDFVKTHIAALERELGFELFDKRSRGVRTLTLAGNCYLADARRTLELHRSALERARDWDVGAKGILRIGLCEEAVTNRLAATVAEFTANHGGVALEVKEGGSADLAGAVRSRTIDVALTLPDIEDAGLVLREMWDDPWLVALPLQHRLVSLDEIGCADLADEALILADPQLPLHGHEHIRSQFQAAGIVPRIGALGVNRSTMLMLTSIGIGATFVPRSMISAGLQGLPSVRLSFRPFVGPSLRIMGLLSQYNAPHLATRFLDSAAAAFAKPDGPPLGLSPDSQTPR